MLLLCNVFERTGFFSIALRSFLYAFTSRTTKFFVIDEVAIAHLLIDTFLDIKTHLYYIQNQFKIPCQSCTKFEYRFYIFCKTPFYFYYTQLIVPRCVSIYIVCFSCNSSVSILLYTSQHQTSFVFSCFVRAFVRFI